MSVINAHSAFAQGDDFPQRYELAQKIQALKPARAQVHSAIEVYVKKFPPQNRAADAASLKDVLNYKALEKISVDAYAEVYTAAELQAMVEYYSKPEAVSAADKSAQYAAKVYPEIIRMLDAAVMRSKMGSP